MAASNSVDLYPAGPNDVPAGLTLPSKAYKRNAWLAVGGLLTFIAAYIGLTGWFAYKAVTLLPQAWAKGSLTGIGAGLVAGFLAVFLGKALFFIRHREDDTLLELRESEQPALFAFVRRIADEAGAPRPYRVYLSARVNAAVFYDLSLLNLLIPSRKNLEIGLGLVNVLTLSELKAVLAHEFGHFAQRSMAVGRWVYVGQQIAAHIVEKRDVLDRFLQGISGIDLRVAWIGWLMRLVVWSIRSLMDSLFRVVVLAERALSREMELQADRVAVSLTGSDALIDALYKLSAADDAWDKAVDVVNAQLPKERAVTDLFTLQSRVIEHMRRIVGPDAYGELPSPPAEGREGHRLFEEGIGSPPQMWSTHPANHIRERNAKERYIAAAGDERPAWLLFQDPPAVRRAMTQHLIASVGIEKKLEPMPDEEALAELDSRFEKAYLDPQYHGLYLGRTITRPKANLPELYGPVPSDAPRVAEELQSAYPDSLGEEVRALRDLEKEHAQLQAIADGRLRAPGGLIHYRGQQIRRRDLPEVLRTVERERDAHRNALEERDARVRVAHWAAGRALGGGWAEHLEGLLRLLHYAEHNEADIDDAMGRLVNVWDVVTADGRVSGSERRRLIIAANELQVLLEQLWLHREHVVPCAPVLERMEAQSWPSLLEEQFGLPPADENNIGDFMEVVTGWHNSFSQPLAKLRFAALEALLDAENQVSWAFLAGTQLAAAPPPCVVPAQYRVFLPGSERELQKKLDWWDRFATADGMGPGVARFAVAGGIVATVVGFGAMASTPTVVIHNGLGREVAVTIGSTEERVGPHAHAEVDVDAADMLLIETRTTDGKLVERFEQPIDAQLGTYVYNVAGASSFVEWTAVYGSGPEVPQTPLGATRWFETEADHVLEEPPESVSTRSGVTERRTVLATTADLPPEMSLAIATDPRQRARMSLAHAQWDPLGAPYTETWLGAANTMAAEGFPEVLAARLEENPDDIVLGRLEQEVARDDAEVCRRHAERADAHPDHPGFAYLKLRCIEDVPARHAASLELYERFPGDPWAAYSATFALFAAERIPEAIEALRTARAELGEHFGDLANTQARLGRLVSELTISESELREHSVRLDLAVGHELGEQVNGAYALLARGQLSDALQVTPTDERARMLRLLALSSGAHEDYAELARQLSPDEGLDVYTAVPSLVLALRHGDPTEPYRALLEETADDEAPTVLMFADAEALKSDLEGAERRMRSLVPELAGIAATLGVLTLGDEAPADWYPLSQRLLFAHERPWLTPPPPGEAEEPNASDD